MNIYFGTSGNSNKSSPCVFSESSDPRSKSTKCKKLYSLVMKWKLQSHCAEEKKFPGPFSFPGISIKSRRHDLKKNFLTK